ncbi:MAG TPA: histidinol dehydrogenase, partial [Tepidisphaeraceae bacterium]
MIPILHLDSPEDAARVRQIVQRLRLDPKDLALSRGHRAEQVRTVQTLLEQVAERGDAAVVEIARQFDDPDFQLHQLRVTTEEMAAASGRLEPDLRAALRRSIDQVRQYQTHVMPQPKPPLQHNGRTLGMRWTPLDSAGVYFPGGKASYPSSLIMLAVPAMTAGVKRIVVCTPGSRFGRSDVVMAAAHEVGITEMYRVGGVAAVAALAFGTESVQPVDKIVGPGNSYVQLAKRAVAGCVGIDGYLGPSEILTLADDTADAAYIAADLLAQAEHDPGSCFLLTTSEAMAQRVKSEVQRQLASLKRIAAIEKALREESMIVVASDMSPLIDLVNEIACEHINLQTADDEKILSQLRHG